LLVYASRLSNRIAEPSQATLQSVWRADLDSTFCAGIHKSKSNVNPIVLNTIVIILLFSCVVGAFIELFLKVGARAACLQQPARAML
jgi:capsular polysaccharide biosynthesis protein